MAFLLACSISAHGVFQFRNVAEHCHWKQKSKNKIFKKNHNFFTCKQTNECAFKILSDLNQAVSYYLPDEKKVRLPDTPLDHPPPKEMADGATSAALNHPLHPKFPIGDGENVQQWTPLINLESIESVFK